MEARVFADMWTDNRRYWQQRARLRRPRALERKYIWDLQTEIINATIQEPRDQQHIESLLLDLTAATAGAQQRTGV
jgi:hypothetical protein